MQARAGAGIVVSDPWIREAPPMAPMAGYLSIDNLGGADRALVSARSDQFGAVMIHRSFEEDGLAKMVHQDRVELPAGERVTFGPGGLHLMLMHPKNTLAPGQRSAISLEFEDGEVIEVEFEIRARQ